MTEVEGYAASTAKDLTDEDQGNDHIISSNEPTTSMIENDNESEASTRELNKKTAAENAVKEIIENFSLTETNETPKITAKETTSSPAMPINDENADKEKLLKKIDAKDSDVECENEVKSTTSTTTTATKKILNDNKIEKTSMANEENSVAASKNSNVNVVATSTVFSNKPTIIIEYNRDMSNCKNIVELVKAEGVQNMHNDHNDVVVNVARTTSIESKNIKNNKNNVNDGDVDVDANDMKIHEEKDNVVKEQKEISTVTTKTAKTVDSKMEIDEVKTETTKCEKSIENSNIVATVVADNHKSNDMLMEVDVDDDYDDAAAHKEKENIDKMDTNDDDDDNNKNEKINNNESKLETSTEKQQQQHTDKSIEIKSTTNEKSQQEKDVAQIITTDKKENGIASSAEQNLNSSIITVGDDDDDDDDDENDDNNKDVNENVTKKEIIIEKKIYNDEKCEKMINSKELKNNNNDIGLVVPIITTIKTIENIEKDPLSCDEETKIQLAADSNNDDDEDNNKLSISLCSDSDGAVVINSDSESETNLSSTNNINNNKQKQTRSKQQQQQQQQQQQHSTPTLPNITITATKISPTTTTTTSSSTKTLTTTTKNNTTTNLNNNNINNVVNTIVDDDDDDDDDDCVVIEDETTAPPATAAAANHHSHNTNNNNNSELNKRKNNQMDNGIHQTLDVNCNQPPPNKRQRGHNISSVVNTTLTLKDARSLVQQQQTQQQHQHNINNNNISMGTNNIGNNIFPVNIAASVVTTTATTAGTNNIYNNNITLTTTTHTSLTATTKGIPKLVPMSSSPSGSGSLSTSAYMNTNSLTNAAAVVAAANAAAAVTAAANAMMIGNGNYIGAGMPTNATLLPGLTDDMFVLEAPSFIVPYIYEKPPADSLKLACREIEMKFKLTREDLADADKSDEFDMMTEQNKDDKNELDLKSKTNATTTSSTCGTSTATTNDKNKNNNKKRRRGADDPDESWSEESSEDDDDDDDDDDSDAGMRTKVLIKEASDDLTALKGAIKPASSIVLQSTTNQTSSSSSAATASSGANINNNININNNNNNAANLSGNMLTGGIDMSQGMKSSHENYFESPLGKFFMDIGVGLVQEFVQSDLIRLQKRKMRKSLGKNLMDFERAITALSGNLEASRKKNAAFKFTLKRCEFCNFKSESALAMANHYETPHMNGIMYKCNFCTFEIRNATEIVYHMEAMHNIKARLIKPLPYHQCPNCGFEDNGKAKLARHQPVCAKKFRPEINLIPPSDWEAPAKIPRIKPRHGLVGTATAYQVSFFLFIYYFFFFY